VPTAFGMQGFGVSIEEPQGSPNPRHRIGTRRGKNGS